MTRTRPANLQDAEAIARIYDEGITDRVATFETEPRTTDDIARGLSERAPRWPTVVVERDGRGVWKLLSRVFPENEASRRLLARVGFREVGRYRRR